MIAMQMQCMFHGGIFIHGYDGYDAERKRTFLSLFAKRSVPSIDDRRPHMATVRRARRIVTILYSGQQIQKYRSNAMAVIRSVEKRTCVVRNP